MTAVHQLPPEVHDEAAQKQAAGILTALGTGVAAFFAAHGGKYLFTILKRTKKEKDQSRADLIAEIRAEERSDARDEARLRIVEDKVIGVRAEVLMIREDVGKLYEGQNRVALELAKMNATMKATRCPAAPKKTDTD